MIERRMAGPDDEPFLIQLYASTRWDEVAAWGWSPAQQEAFLAMQFRAQRQSYAMQYEGAERLILLQEGAPIGRLLVHRTADELLLVDISLLPESRGKGIGTSLVRELQAEAAATDRPLRLRVARENPARRLYARLGFVMTAEQGPYDAMEWRAPGRTRLGGV